MHKKDIDEILNNQIRKFLKQVGINSHRRINENFLAGKKSIIVKMQLEIDGTISDEFESEIKV
jgi:hypothetical protein